MRRLLSLTCGVVLLAAPPATAQSLRGSQASVNRQYRVARQHDFTFLKSAADVRRFVNLDLLVPVTGGRDYELAGVSFAYARPAVRTFIQRLSAQYRRACGEELVVTSLTRPTSEQPNNASDLSVHPAGMAVDLRRSNRTVCRRWLERTLLSLERAGVLEATRERHPAHYHVAVFPTQYTRYVTRLQAAARTRLAVASAADDDTYRVNPGDSLWSIARRLGTTVQDLKNSNGLTSSRIHPGQVLTIPGG